MTAQGASFSDRLRCVKERYRSSFLLLLPAAVRLKINTASKRPTVPQNGNL